MTKKDTIKHRQQAILALIRDYAIKDQQSLLQLLKSHYQITSNQTVISRDLQQLGIGKTKVKGDFIYELPEQEAEKAILTLAVKKVVHNEHMIVIHTIEGLADFVGDYLDSKSNLEILGTLAGENVVFITPHSINNITSTYQKICNAILYKITPEEAIHENN